MITKLASRLKSTVELAQGERYRNVAVGTGAAAAGAGIAYAGIHAGRAAKATGKAANEAAKATRTVRHIGASAVVAQKKIVRSGVFIKRQLAKLPGLGKLKLEAKGPVLEFATQEKKKTSPAIKAGISAALSGATFGLIPAFRRGTTLKKALKSVATGAAAGAAVGGGGTAIGTRILGDPKKREGAAITKRAALGGAIAGLAGGATLGVLAHKTRTGRRLLVQTSKNWRPARWARKSGVPGAVVIGGGAGAIVGGVHAADEGQQVDTLNTLKRHRLSRRLTSTINFAIGYEAGVPLTGKVARDRYVKKIRDEDLDRRDANLARAAIAGAAAGVLTRGKLSKLRKAAIGASAGAAGVIAVRRATDSTRDPYGERSREGKRAEALPIAAGIATAGIMAARRGRSIIARRFSATLAVIELDTIANDAGWDVRDPRGKSARVFAPGSKQRTRRPKKWHEKVENQRTILTTAGITGTAVGLISGSVLGRRLALSKVKPVRTPSSWQRPGYRTKKVSVVSRRTFREAGEQG